MALTYIPEDGSASNPLAYGYAPSLAFIRAYNAQRGITLPAEDDALIALATVAIDVIEQYEPRFKGSRALPLVQPLSWPRTGVYIDVPAYRGGTMFPADGIPSRLQNAHAYLTGVALTVELTPVMEGRAVTKEVIGPLETDYSVTAGAPTRPLIPQLDAMLSALLTVGSGVLKSVRV